MTHIPVLIIVDDNAVDQKLYRRIVERAGIVDNLLTFLRAKEALDHLEKHPTSPEDLILLDINMPGMDGFGFLDRLEKMFELEYAPVVVMLTTSLSPIDEERARSYSVVRDFLRKPLTIELLKELAVT